MRKFYKTIFQMTVLSQYPVNDLTLDQVAAEIDYGDCVGELILPFCEEISPFVCANELCEMGRKPEFFGLDENGNEIL